MQKLIVKKLLFGIHLTEKELGTMARFFGYILFLGGFWFISQNVVFSSRVSFFTWQGISAGGSVVLLVGGLIGFFFGAENMRLPSMAAVAGSLVLILLSGTLYIQPTSLAEVFIGFVAIAAGGSLIQGRKINF